MFKYMQRHSTILKYLSCSFRRFPAISHIKLYCLSAVKHKNYTSDIRKKQTAEPAVLNEFIIYESDNSKFFLKLSVLSILNYTIWCLLGVSTYQLGSKPSEGNLETSWFAHGNKSHLIKSLVILSLTLGALLVVSVWFYILRSIKTILLRKGSKEVIFETYTPINTIRRFTVPLQHVSGVMSRHKVKGYIPLKIKDKIFYFLVDVNGTFRNPSLFDSAIAIKRDLKK